MKTKKMVIIITQTKTGKGATETTRETIGDDLERLETEHCLEKIREMIYEHTR